ncbi:hypothetical protein Pyn_03317 [Prunus yedoensis var. nudiflora]|uniref:Uncharacterized protein n=1 Tax=Prunus yedoensis var. nudiflora TaxID=2094558 RepID=A0A314Z3B5_PRUYE|nr:hypothetical protein Pyn_03317 [Prunus yedoensis var. nudiflora]
MSDRPDPALAAAQPQLMDLLHDHRSNAQSRVHNAATFLLAKSRLDTMLPPNKSIGHFGIALYLHPHRLEEFIDFLEGCIFVFLHCGMCVEVFVRLFQHFVDRLRFCEDN